MKYILLSFLISFFVIGCKGVSSGNSSAIGADSGSISSPSNSQNCTTTETPAMPSECRTQADIYNQQQGQILGQELARRGLSGIDTSGYASQQRNIISNNAKIIMQQCYLNAGSPTNKSVYCAPVPTAPIVSTSPQPTPIQIITPPLAPVQVLPIPTPAPIVIQVPVANPIIAMPLPVIVPTPLPITDPLLPLPIAEYALPWTSTATSSSDPSTQVPTARRGHTVIWTGNEMIVWGGTQNSNVINYDNMTSTTNTGGRYNPTTNSWIFIPNSYSFQPSAREGHTAIWTGNEMIIWGGYQSSQKINGAYVNAGFTNTGGAYNPIAKTWFAIPDAPSSLSNHISVWTGSKMIVWGNGTGSGMGYIYDPISFTWNKISNVNAPTPKKFQTAIWTGTEMIVWNGDGGRYNPTTDTWTSISTTSAPKGIGATVWTGSEMIVYGGNGAGRTGASYNPKTDIWTSLSKTDAPVGTGSTAVWTGSEMIIWGGGESDGSTLTYYNTGARYNPLKDSWIKLSSSSPPTARTAQTAIWTGTEMIIWGGGNMSTGLYVNTGGKLAK